MTTPSTKCASSILSTVQIVGRSGFQNCGSRSTYETVQRHRAGLAMSMRVFAEYPDLWILRALARGSLKQNLLRAVRLWVWLRLLYANPEDLPPNLWDLERLPAQFTFADWRSVFFSPSHPATEKAPPLHDAACACAKTMQDWLTLLAPTLDLAAWKATLKQHDSLPSTINRLLNQRLFGVTRRSLDEDLRQLEKLGWLQRQGQHYCRVSTFPRYSGPVAERGRFQPLLHPDLVAIADTLSQTIGGHQRFFMHVEYIVPTDATDRVDDWQAQLKQIWEKAPVVPIKLRFYSAKLDARCTRIVYPVCVYYAQRGPYLCAWGQVPEGEEQPLDWRNYRLDRILGIQPLTWDTPGLPPQLHKAYQHDHLPTPEFIQEQMETAWGFDFYQPTDTLLVRFEREFAKRYIDNSLRHDTFIRITYPQAKQQVRSQVQDSAMQQQMLCILAERSAQDSYYTALFRRHDLNIRLRLRAWRPHMEVLLPWKLRQQIADEVQQEFELYQNK